jgi:hypothetical protein
MFKNSIIVVNETVLKIAPVTVFITMFANFVLIIPTEWIKLVHLYLQWRRAELSSKWGNI